MNFFRLFFLYRVHVIYIITTLLSLLLYFSNDSDEVKSVQADFSDIISVILGPKKWYKDILNIKEKNEYLMESVGQLRLLNTELIHLKHENNELREMLSFKNKTPLSLIGGTVVNSQLSGFLHTLTLNSGLNDGVVPNLPIIDINGLLGKTNSVGDRATSVQLITDKNFRVSIRVGEKWNLGLFIPSHGKFGYIEGVPKSQKVIPGDIVVTSGISNIYPGDIPVAKVISVEVDSERPFLKIIVELSAEVHNSNFVFIVQ